jgi:SAM-dependent methyltransferase
MRQAIFTNYFIIGFTMSLETLTILNQYQDFLNNIETVSDMGCGIGTDSNWWASLAKHDGTLRNIKVNAIDIKLDSRVTLKHPNINYIAADFSASTLPANSQDFVWAHDSFQFSLNPFHTLNHWYDIMKVDGMLLITIPYCHSIHSHRDIQTVDITHMSNSYYNWTLGSLIMLLVANGFDCRQGHFKFDRVNGWIQAAVYKLPTRPNPTISWYEMVDEKLLPASIEASILKNGNFNESDIVCEWIDRSQYILAL